MPEQQQTRARLTQHCQKLWNAEARVEHGRCRTDVHQRVHRGYSLKVWVCQHCRTVAALHAEGEEAARAEPDRRFQLRIADCAAAMPYRRMIGIFPRGARKQLAKRNILQRQHFFTAIFRKKSYCSR